MRFVNTSAAVSFVLCFCTGDPSSSVTLAVAPKTVPRFDVAEFEIHITSPPFRNPFTEATFTGTFTAPGGAAVSVTGFCDSQDGSVFKLRFCPQTGNAVYAYELRLAGAGIDQSFKGRLRCTPSKQPGPVVVGRDHPKHFVYAGSGKPFYHLGHTAYHLLDPSNSLEQIDATIDYCGRNGFNKLRFLLTGYPRDFDRRTSTDVEQGVPDPRRAPNYGAPPGQVNPLPAWPGAPHAYDFTRFNVAHWQRVDYAIRRMRERNIVATCIVTIEKQNLPDEYGRLTEHEYRLYRYAVNRLAAFDNVWWDLGNEHNEYRNRQWAETMGEAVKDADPYDRLTSVHAYAEFFYEKSAWADFIITQQYGDEKAVHDWVIKYLNTPKPYVNEEYGYEGSTDKPGHGQSADWTRRNHWSIAMAGGYATYGDWSGNVSYYYTGEPGPGPAAPQLKHLRSFFETIPYQRLVPRDDLTALGFCLADPPRLFVFYFPRGGEAQIRLEGPADRLQSHWFDPRAGAWNRGPLLKAGMNVVKVPQGGDWVLKVWSR